MTLCHSWSMSAAGLSAPGLRSVPLRSMFAHATHCHGAGSARPYWDQSQDLDNLCFGLDAATEDYNLKPQHHVPVCDTFERQLSAVQSPQSPSAQRLPPKKFRPSLLILPSSMEVSLPSPPEGDQVVPSFQRLSVYEHGPSHASVRGAKPLPPLPGHVDSSSDEIVDNEVEFFTSVDESQRLVPDAGPRSTAFHYKAPGRRSFRGCGQINYAYFEDTGAGERQLAQPAPPSKVPSSTRDVPRQQERSQRRLRRSQSGPAGSLNKGAALRLSCANTGARATDKPEVPPRVPIPPRPSKLPSEYRRWSAEVPSVAFGDEHKPPKVPPREPVCHGSPRTPSPKSLPSYTNGVMPPTQSFAPNPKYVSLQRQSSVGSPTPHGPCILPIIENGRKASATHYFLLPKRPAYLDRDGFERFFKEADWENNGSSSPDWDSETQQKPHVEMV